MNDKQLQVIHSTNEISSIHSEIKTRPVRPQGHQPLSERQLAHVIGGPNTRNLYNVKIKTTEGATS